MAGAAGTAGLAAGCLGGGGGTPTPRVETRVVTQEGGGTVVKTVKVTQGPGLKTFENDAGQDVGANFEAVQDLAQDEGATTFYATLDRESMAPLIETFRSEFGVGVNHITGGSETILSRFENEYKSGSPLADTMVVGEPKITRTWENGQTMQIEADYVPAIEDMPDKFTTAGNNPGGLDGVHWVSLRQLMASYFYNTDMVDAGAASDWMDVVTNDEWSDGSLGHDPTPNIGMVWWLREKYGDEYFNNLADQSPRWVDSHTDLARFCGAGEFPVAFTYTHKMGRFGNDLPVDIFRFDPMPAGLSPYIVNNKAPSPNAGLLWYNWLISPEGQTELGKGQYIPVHPDAEYSGYPNIYPSTDYEVDTFFTPFEVYSNTLDYWKNIMGDAI